MCVGVSFCLCCLLVCGLELGFGDEVWFGSWSGVESDFIVVGCFWRIEFEGLRRCSGFGLG